jgi:diguanylate cyclase (GGDEF)-like protein/putative nucleotidyltransferase with HDIG domain
LCTIDMCFKAPADSAHRLRSAANTIAKVGPQAPLDELKNAIVHTSAETLDADLVALFMVDPYTAEINCVSTKGVKRPIQLAFIDVFGSRLTDPESADIWFERDILNNEFIDPIAQQAFRRAGIAALVAAPIWSGVGVCGAIVIFSEKNCEPLDDWLEMLRAVTAQASLALSYALAIDQSTQLLEGLAGKHRELSEQANTDGLTNLLNHRALQQRLSELTRVRSSKGPQVFSLVMIDVDHFKIYNDTYGHREGDAALRHVAKIISSSLRQNDIAARYGGEEFALVFKGLSKENAEQVANRIRKAVAERPCKYGPLTVSMGIAEFPIDGSTPGEIIERADRALYHAKITGRNRVVVWGSIGCGLDITQDATRESATAQKNLLVVEQSEGGDCTSLKDLLINESYQIMALSNPTEATTLLRTKKFDLVLVHRAILPDDDFKTLSKIATIRPDIPVVLVASDMTLEESRKALRLGATDILLMPCKPTELQIVIERNLERKRIERLRLSEKSTDVMLQAIDALVAAIDAKDPYMAGHSQRVTAISLAIADELEMPYEERYVLELAARLHDIGKIGLPDSALNKQTHLTEEEWCAMREHPVLGSKIVGEIDDLSRVSTIIRHHHERLDGTGYPDGLVGSAIPYLAQIIAVADVYEAMTSERAYRGRLSPKNALQQLRLEAGTRFNSDIISILERCLIKSGELNENEAA